MTSLHEAVGRYAKLNYRDALAGGLEKRQADQRDLADFAAKLLDETPIDETWLQEIGFVNSTYGGYLLNGNGIFIEYRSYRTHRMWIVGNQALEAQRIRSRGQLRALCFGLGVELSTSSERN